MSQQPEHETHAQLLTLRQRASSSISAASVGRDEMSLAFEPSWASGLELLVGGQTFFPRIGEDMEAASHSIHVNQFGFKPGPLGDAATELLAAKAREGLAVRLVVDDQGSLPFSLSKAMYSKLAAAGVEIVVNQGFRPISKRGLIGGDLRWRSNLRGLGRPDHRKAIIIDGRVAYVGGAGFQDHFETGEFHDLFVRMTGAVVSQFQLVFLTSFRYLGGPPVPDLDDLLPLVEPHDDAASATVLHNAPGFRPITVAIMEILDSARETLDVVNPYVADPAAVRRLIAAAERGVQVRLLVPGKPNNSVLALAQRHHHAALLEAGVEIWEHPRMIHSKAFVRDGVEVLVGTCNLEAWSLYRSYEIDLRARSTALADQFRTGFFDAEIATSRPAGVPTGIVSRSISAVIARFHPFL